MTNETERRSELHETLAALAGLSRGQMAELVTGVISPQDAESFAVFVEYLSVDALRFLSARALMRQRQL